MATFYGTVKGNRGGIRVSAQSWDGSVTVSMIAGDSGPLVTILASAGSAVGGRVLWQGPIPALLSAGAGFTLRAEDRP